MFCRYLKKHEKILFNQTPYLSATLQVLNVCPININPCFWTSSTWKPTEKVYSKSAMQIKHRVFPATSKTKAQWVHTKTSFGNCQTIFITSVNLMRVSSGKFCLWCSSEARNRRKADEERRGKCEKHHLLCANNFPQFFFYNPCLEMCGDYCRLCCVYQFLFTFSKNQLNSFTSIIACF